MRLTEHWCKCYWTSGFHDPDKTNHSAVHPISIQFDRQDSISICTNSERRSFARRDLLNTYIHTHTHTDMQGQRESSSVLLFTALHNIRLPSRCRLPPVYLPPLGLHFVAIPSLSAIYNSGKENCRELLAWSDHSRVFRVLCQCATKGVFRVGFVCILEENVAICNGLFYIQ